MDFHESFNKLNENDLLSTLIIFTAVIFIVHLILLYNKNKKLPPGPWGIPLLGNITILGKYPLTKLQKFREQYGDIYSLRFGSWPVVVISGKDAIKTALQYNGDKLSDRPELLSVKQLSGMKGIAFCHYDQAHIFLRKTGFSALKIFSRSSNKRFQEILESESQTLINEMLSHGGELFNPHNCLYFAAASVIYRISFGDNHDLRNDKEMAWAVRNTMTLNKFAFAFNPLNAFPWLRFLLPRKFNSFLLYHDYANRVGNAHIQKQTGIMDGYDKQEVRHLVDALISISKENEIDEKGVSKLTNEMILSLVGDFIGAGFDTTATTLEWGFLFLASHPEIQEKVQKELDDVVGRSRKPSIHDRKKLHYTDSVILEILRMSTTLPFALPHCASADTNLLGYNVPKGTVILIDLLSTNRDPHIWNSPNEFKPERFLDTDGKIDPKLADNILSFGIGRRRCVGEELARTNLFVFLTSVLQRCKIIKPQKETYNLEGTLSFIYSPKAYKIKVVERN